MFENRCEMVDEMAAVAAALGAPAPAADDCERIEQKVLDRAAARALVRLLPRTHRLFGHGVDQ